MSMLKIALIHVKNVCFDVKKGISGLLRCVAHKHTDLVIHFTQEVVNLR